jgi:hypothetical protein
VRSRQHSVFIVHVPWPTPPNTQTTLTQPTGFPHSTAMMNLAIIQRLDSLYEAVRSEDNKGHTYRHDDKFLSENGIRLARHDFTKPPPKDTKPTMFFTRYSAFSKSYPIDMNAFDSDRDKERFLRYRDFKPSEKFTSPMSRTTYARNYLLQWTVGGQIPRRLPSGWVDLLISRHINLVR